MYETHGGYAKACIVSSCGEQRLFVLRLAKGARNLFWPTEFKGPIMPTYTKTSGGFTQKSTEGACRGSNVCLA